MDARQKIIEYHSLKRQKSLIEKRLDELRNQIAEKIIADELEPITTGNLKASIQTRRSKPKPDDALLETMLDKKGLLNLALVMKVDHDIVESMYLKGDLTDDDLRSIGAEPKVTLALIVEEVDEDCIKE